MEFAPGRPFGHLLSAHATVPHRVQGDSFRDIVGNVEVMDQYVHVVNESLVVDVSHRGSERVRIVPVEAWGA